jgi:DNA primase small subunit
MVKKVPHKIDMGAVYTKEPNQKNLIAKDAFKEVSREFILDIDLTDYQEDGTIKSNCIDPTDPDFCKSWKFMSVACQVRMRVKPRSSYAQPLAAATDAVTQASQ